MVSEGFFWHSNLDPKGAEGFYIVQGEACTKTQLYSNVWYAGHGPEMIDHQSNGDNASFEVTSSQICQVDNQD